MGIACLWRITQKPFTMFVQQVCLTCDAVPAAGLSVRLAPYRIGGASASSRHTRKRQGFL